jgi:hypothetical protein
MTAVWLVATALTVTLKAAALDPVATKTVGGGTALPLLLERFTVTPPEGELAVRATTQLRFPAPDMVVGPQASPETCGSPDAAGARVIEVVCWPPLAAAVITAVWLLVTAPTLAVKAAVVDAAPTVAEEGTDTLVLLLERLTARLVVGAALRVTVQDEVPAAVKLAGAQTRPVGTGLEGGADAIETAPPVPLMERLFPNGSAADIAPI